MAVDFRCENCGKLLSVDEEPGNAVRCPHCRKKVTVPAGLASLPRPHVPPNASAPPPASGASPDGQNEGEEEEEPIEDEAVMGAMATIMPWVISAFLHVGVFLIMLFFVMVTVNSGIPLDVIVPDAAMTSDNPGGVVNPKTPTVSRSQNDRRTVVKRHTKHEDQVDKGKTEQTIQLLAASADGASGGAAELGLTNSDAAGGPRCPFFGAGGNAHHVVYVIDRSGSMAPTFQEVMSELTKSIANLKPVQTFTIIFFGENQCIQGPGRALVSASMQNKLNAAKFVKGVTSHGATVVLPALKKAFDVLKYADKTKSGRLIYLFSDGDFAGISGGSTYKGLSGNEAVIQWLKDNNPKEEAKGRVHIKTFLYLNTDPEPIKVMTAVAKQNGGTFHLISGDQ